MGEASDHEAPPPEEPGAGHGDLDPPASLVFRRLAAPAAPPVLPLAPRGPGGPPAGSIGEDHVVVSSQSVREWAHVADAPQDAIAAPPVADFDTFMAENFEKVRRWIEVVLNRDDPTQAEDIAQEAFLRAYMRWARVSAMDKPAGWVARVAWHLALAWLRRPERAIAPDVVMSEPGGSSPDAVIGRIDLERALAEIPAQQREVLVLSISGFGRCEISVILGIPPATVGTRLPRSPGAGCAVG
jgi:RNA polymerase sigma factor (sigma-70 family)